jgi:hypothetical protein
LSSWDYNVIKPQVAALFRHSVGKIGVLVDAPHGVAGIDDGQRALPAIMVDLIGSSRYAFTSGFCCISASCAACMAASSRVLME